MQSNKVSQTMSTARLFVEKRKTGNSTLKPKQENMNLRYFPIGLDQG